MTLQQRDLLHSHKRRHVVRAAVAEKETTTAATATTTTTTPAKTTSLVLSKITTPLTTAKSTAATTSTTSTSVTSLTTSSTTSASVPSTTSTTSTTSAAPITTSTPVTSVTPQAPSTTFPTTSASNTIALSSSETSAVSSPSATVTPNSGLGTGTILGVVAGVVGGLLVLGLVIAFFLRRLRKKHNRAEFDSAEFRRSAVAIPEKDDEKPGLRPRPPSMIERKNIAAQSASSLRSLPAPSMTYPYSDRASMAPSAPASTYGSDHGHQGQHYAAGAGGHYTAIPQAPPAPYNNNAIPGAYGVPPPLAPYNGAQYDQAGFGAPPIPGTYGPGAYASYGADPRYPQQYPHQQQGQGYPQYSSYQQQGQAQPQFAPPPQQQQHQMYGYARGPAPQAAQQPNAFARGAPTSPPPAPASPAPFSDLVDVPAAQSGHRRQPTQSSGAPPAYEVDEDAERRAAMRDQKIRPQDNMAVRNGEAGAAAGASVSATASAATVSAPARPLSSHTVYDDGDAYGGM